MEIINGKSDVIGINEAAAGVRNVISGNKADGIYLSGGTLDVVAGNFIGTNVTGSAAIANGRDGVSIAKGSSDVIGGTATAQRNVISGNNSDGVYIAGGSLDVVEGDLIGTDGAGTAAIANGNYGVEIASGKSDKIGGMAFGASNVLSGNKVSGIILRDPTAIVVQGNLVGTNETGLIALPNNGDGVDVNGAGNNSVGNATISGNVISGNKGSGLSLTNGATRDLITRNSIGTDKSGSVRIANVGYGVNLVDAYSNTIGGSVQAVGETITGAGNVIAGNAGNGILFGLDAYNNMVLGNFIGTNRSGATGLGDGGDGVDLLAGSYSNAIGAPAPGT